MSVSVESGDANINGYRYNNDENFFGKVANIYCKENPKHWINLTNGIYSNVQGNYFYYSTQASAKIEEDNAKVLHKTKI